MLSENLKAVLDGRLWGTAEKVMKHYQSTGYKVTQLMRIDDTYRFKPHIVCKKHFETLAIDIRERCNIEKHYEDFVTGCQAKRVAVKIYFAIPEILGDTETVLTLIQRANIKTIGIGLITVSDNKIEIDPDTISCNRRFALEPGTSLGKHTKTIDVLIGKYNLGDCIGAIKSLVEEAEDATFLLATKAIKKGKINATLDEIANHEIDWATIIDGMAAKVWKGSSQTQIITEKKFKQDLHNFRDKRNLTNHRKTAKQLRDLESQYPEAMYEGIRVIRELVRLNNSLR